MEENYKNASNIVSKLTLDALAGAKHAANTEENIYSSGLIHLTCNLMKIINNTYWYGEERVTQEVFKLLHDTNVNQPSKLPHWLKVTLNP